MVEEPEIDGDSDHTDSGATIDSKYTCELLTYLGTPATHSVEDGLRDEANLLTSHVLCYALACMAYSD